MHKRTSVLLMSILAVAMLLLSACAAPAAAPAAPAGEATTAPAGEETAAKPMKIGALVKNDSNPFFLTMKDGYNWAGERYGLDIVVGSTPTEDATDEQLAILETWLNEGGFDGFIVTPFRATSLNSALATATEQGIPIINIDELIPADAAKESGIKLAAQLASNNVYAGQLAGDLIASLVPAGAQVAVIEGAAGTTSSIDRVTGFTERAKELGLEVVASQPADWDRAKAFDVASNILQGNPDVKAIFAANDGMGLGAVEAVESAGLAGQVQVASVDAIPEALEAVKAGRLAGTVAQYPDEMAVIAVEAMKKVIEGRPIAPFIEAPIQMITQATLDKAGSQLGDAAMGNLKIGAITKNLSNEFFLTMIEGYEKAAADMGITVDVGSTPTEDATDEQLAILETWLNDGSYQGIIATPFRATSLNSALARATEMGLPIINIDELIPADAAKDSGINIAQRISSDNVRAGSLAGQYFVENLPAGSEVAIIEGAAGTTSSIDRVTGFKNAAEAGGLKVVASQPADWDRAKAFDTATNMLQGNPNVVGIFAANDGMGLGAVEAVEAAGLGGTVIVASVDAIPEALAAVREGRLAGTVAQFPDEMAYLAIEGIVKLIEGRPVAPFMESPVVLYTKDNVPAE
jgi:ABC-type sugar transport system substrate-binding protein